MIPSEVDPSLIREISRNVKKISPQLEDLSETIESCNDDREITMQHRIYESMRRIEDMLSNQDDSIMQRRIADLGQDVQNIFFVAVSLLLFSCLTG